MRKASRIYKRKNRSNLETFIILIGAIIILGVAFNLARDRSYIPPEEPIIAEEEKVESPVMKVPVALPQEETREKVEEKVIFSEEEIKKESPLVKTEVKVANESKIATNKILYTIQVGAFSKEGAAQSLAKEIRGKGYQVYVVKGKVFYKVQVEEFTTSNKAKEISEELKKLGYETWITTR